jgi:hypothetical protein
MLRGSIVSNYTNESLFSDVATLNQSDVSIINVLNINTYEIASICIMAATIMATFCGVGVCWWQLKSAFAHSI